MRTHNDVITREGCSLSDQMYLDTCAKSFKEVSCRWERFALLSDMAGLTVASVFFCRHSQSFISIPRSPKMPLRVPCAALYSPGKKGFPSSWIPFRLAGNYRTAVRLHWTGRQC